MTEFPSQSHKAREPREVKPVVMTPGKITKAPAGRRLMETFFQGDFKSTISSMIWNTFFPNLRDNMADSVHDGIDSLFHGQGGGGSRSRSRGGSSRFAGSQISRHSPDRALAGRSERFSKEDREQQRVDRVEIGSRAEAEEVLAALNRSIDQFDAVTLAEFYQLVDLSPSHTDYKFGWDDLGGAGVVHSRGGYYLDLPPVITLK